VKERERKRERGRERKSERETERGREGGQERDREREKERERQREGGGSGKKMAMGGLVSLGARISRFRVVSCSFGKTSHLHFSRTKLN
jgi:hypothetical protein